MRVTLVGAELEENLGLRYTASALELDGHETAIVPFNTEYDIVAAVAEVRRFVPQGAIPTVWTPYPSPKGASPTSALPLPSPAFSAVAATAAPMTSDAGQTGLVKRFAIAKASPLHGACSPAASVHGGKIPKGGDVIDKLHSSSTCVHS